MTAVVVGRMAAHRAAAAARIGAPSNETGSRRLGPGPRPTFGGRATTASGAAVPTRQRPSGW